ncbi:hypothetical protein [Sulfurimonas sp.]|jgi:hypothetical protein|uniref:hypothetical protein n=1 Tax=Sulfurimonas sp. TaxID=2022749 RepID=UPI0025F741F3|nr:hypothetical protein [Sulfurimonas sp.]MCK9472125.1 hypothetical protein [Sulfurimonas sp.]MDD3505174.1 hypothetical protein [Sulfurimonas sp.]
MNKISIAISVAALLMYGCSDKPKEQESSTQISKSVEESIPKSMYGVPATEQAQANAPAKGNVQLNTPHIAKALETINGGGYTYAKVDEGGNIYWIAGPQTNVVVGSSISFLEQMVMNDFTSKSLNKHFDQLVFVSAIVPADGSATDASAKTLTLEDAHANCDHSKEPATTATVTQPDSAAISVAKNKGGYTIEELYTKKAALKDKSVKINAKIVKISKNIMGKDWIHLQDGSGSAGTNDIIATAVNSTVQVGDTVTANGIVKTDIDLGYGYNFSVLIEEAKFTSL